MGGYFSVKNFEKLQHYKDRTPPWIRLYNSLLDDYEFGLLPDASKAHLLAIWLLASRYDNKIPYDPEWVSRRINATDPVDLDILTKSGFIIFDQECSVMLAECKQDAIPEERRAEESREEKKGGAVAPPYAFVGKVIRLKADDAERWRKAYHAIPDMTAELTKADDYYAENPPKDGKWFFPVSAWMERAHEAALGKRSDGKVMTKFGPMPAEYAKMYQGAL